MLDRLAGAGDFVDQKAWRQAFETYSEAIAYRLLRNAGGHRISVERMPEEDSLTPDFKCTLAGDPPRTFWVEVKTLDVVHADQRHAEMLDEGMLARDRLDKQVASGKRFAMTMSEIAPFRKARRRTWDTRRATLKLFMTGRYAGRETMAAKTACVRAVKLPTMLALQPAAGGGAQ